MELLDTAASRNESSIENMLDLLETTQAYLLN